MAIAWLSHKEVTLKRVEVPPIDITQFGDVEGIMWDIVGDEDDRARCLLILLAWLDQASDNDRPVFLDRAILHAYAHTDNHSDALSTYLLKIVVKKNKG